MKKMSLTAFFENYPFENEKDAPIFLDIKTTNELKVLKQFAKEKYISFYSPIDEQIKEYKEIFQCFHKKDPKDFTTFLKEKIEKDHDVRGNFVFLNWGEKAFFNILPHEMHYELITWRNKEKLTQKEQDILANKTVGIIGSSVGSFATKVLSKSGFQNLKVAEIKNMKPSNCPRMYMDSMRNYGVHKLRPLVQGIYEFNPYINIDYYTEGLQPHNVEDFFTMNGKKLDIVVDAADDAKTKVLIRAYCKKHKIPMLTGFDEKGCLIIERYDRKDLMVYESPQMDVAQLEELKAKDPKQYVMKLLDYFPEGGFENLTQRQKDTIEGIFNQTRGGFSQLAWEAALFSSYITKAVIDIALDKDISGYQFFDLDILISEQMLSSNFKTAS